MIDKQALRILVTGGTRGIGAAICDELAEYELYVGGRDAQQVQQRCAQLPHAHPFVCDLEAPESIAAACAAVAELDVLVLNAGMAFSGTVEEVSHADWQRILTVNVIAQADLLRALLPKLRQRNGLVVAINSGSGYRSGAGGAAYSASKFALRALTDALREEERGRVRVCSVHPGRVDTDMQVELQTNAGRDYRAGDHMPVQAIAQAVRAALEMPENAVVETISVRPVTQL